MRGLKLCFAILKRLCRSRIFYRCVDWNFICNISTYTTHRRIFYRCVDWNSLSITPQTKIRSRIFYRCVDWNLLLIKCKRTKHVASFTDAWIETFTQPIPTTGSFSRIFYRCVDWNIFALIWSGKASCRIFYRCVDWNKWMWKHLVTVRVASFTDAWIETTLNWVRLFKQGVASFTDAWIETSKFNPMEG